jgi:phosphoketolase
MVFCYAKIRRRSWVRMPKKKRNPEAVKLAESIMNSYHPESVEDMQEALQDVFGPLFETMRLKES